MGRIWPQSCYEWAWLGSRVVSVLDSGAEGPGFKSQPRRCRVTVLGKLFTPIVPLFTKQQNWYIAALLGVAGVTEESNGSVYTAEFMTQVTSRLTAKNLDQLRNPTLGNRVGVTFTFTMLRVMYSHEHLPKPRVSHL